MSLSDFYQVPECLDSIDCDLDKVGVPSDHKTVLVQPIKSIDSQSARYYRKVKIRPMKELGLKAMRDWLMKEKWGEVFAAETADEKAQIFQKTILDKLDGYLPEKEIKINVVDQPWFTAKLKKLDRKRKRIYKKEKKSFKWKQLDSEFKEEVGKAKSDFYKKIFQI